MKNIVLASLLLIATAFSGFIALDFRTSFSYDIFSSPYYRILKKTPVTPQAKIGFVPVTLDQRAAQIPTYKNANIPQLQAAINRYAIDNLNLTLLNISTDKQTDLPDTFLGSIIEAERPMYITSDCPAAKDSPDQCIRIVGQLGNKAWMQQLLAEMEKTKTDYAVVLQLGEGYIYPNGKMEKVNALIEKRKSPQAGLDMGTNFWLPMNQKWVATNKPIDVLFLKGILIGKDGKAIRIGAEGITAASKASFMEQVVNISHGFSEAELNAVEKEIFRDDLPNKPLAWQIAAQHLVSSLTNASLKTSGGYVKQ